MKMSSLSGNGALKLLLLLTSLSHHYSGLVTGADPAKGICADIAANKSVDFFLVGANSQGRLLITAKPDYLVYELRNDTLHDDDTVNIYGVTSVPLKDYYPALFGKANLSQLLDSQASNDVKAFTVGHIEHLNMTMYLKIFFPRFKLLFSYNMDTPNLDVITDYNPPILDTQQFVSTFTDLFFSKENVYSFVNQHVGSTRLLYQDSDMIPIKTDTTCKTNDMDTNGTMVLRFGLVNCHDCNRDYINWYWDESPRGWADTTGLGFNNRFYLFDSYYQQLVIFDQDYQYIDRNDVFSVVYQKSYKDFFRCTPTSTTQAPTTSTKPSPVTDVTKVTSRATTVPTTSSQPVNSTTTSSLTECSCPPVTITPSEKPKIALWIIILIVVILVVILITVAFFVGYKLGSSNKSSDTKPDKVTNAASSAKQAQGNSNQLAVGGMGPTSSKLNAKSSAASKARSSMVAPSKGPESKVQGLKAKK